MRRLFDFSERWLRALALAGTGALIFAVGLTVLDIALRSVSTGTVAGMVDIVQLCVMVAAMLAIPFGFVADQHVSIDLFTVRFPAGLQRALRVFAALLGMLFVLAVFWFSLRQAMVEASYGDRSQTIGIPMIWYWIPLLAGMALAVLANLAVALRFAFAGRAGR